MDSPHLRPIFLRHMGLKAWGSNEETVESVESIPIRRVQGVNATFATAHATGTTIGREAQTTYFLYLLYKSEL
jgi:hypothetical protein